MVENERAGEDVEGLISHKNRIMPDFMEDTDTSSAEHVKNSEEAAVEVLNTGTIAHSRRDGELWKCC